MSSQSGESRSRKNREIQPKITQSSENSGGRELPPDMYNIRHRIRRSGPIVPAGDLHLKKFSVSDDEESPGSTLSLHSSPHLITTYSCGIGRTAGKGWGIFAGEDIPAGATAILEQPTLILKYSEKNKKEWLGPGKKSRTQETIEADHLREEFEKLSKEQRLDIMSLHNSQEEYEPSALYGIFLTNFFLVSLRNKISGIYVFCSRLNHSCDPNCDFEFSKAQSTEDTKTHAITVATRRNVKAGDQLTISYVPLKMRLGVRQDHLLMSHGFTCDCARCVTEGDKLYNWPVGEQNGVKLRFRPARLLQTEAGEGQGWDFLTVIEGIPTHNGVVQENEVIMQETPLIVLKKDEMGRNSSLLYGKFSKLTKSQRNKYLRLYNWRVGSESPAWMPGPSYQVESTDEDRHTDLSAWTRKCKPLPSNATLSGIWEANSFALDHGTEGVFAFISHLNHSCWPTCHTIWNTEQDALNLVASMPLSVGEEITICYNYSEIFSLPYEQRQRLLEDNYGFKCRCSRCRADSMTVVALPEPEIHAVGFTGRANKLEQGNA